jgi:hypothetical protein
MANTRMISIIFMVALLFIGIFLGVNFYNKSTSFSTPEAALKNVQNPKLPIENIVYTEILNSRDEAFVFFYSSNPPEDYLGAAKLTKGKYGWKFSEIFGVGPMNATRENGDSISDKDFIMGMVSSDISKVSMGNDTAILIPLKDKDLKIWAFFNPSIKNQEEVEFIN